MLPYGWILFAGALCGIVSGTMSTVPNSIVSIYAESQEERGKFTGWTNACMQGGALLMSLGGGYLGAIQWQYAYFLYFIAVPILLIVIAWMPADKPQQSQAGKPDASLSLIPGKVFLMCLHFALFFVCVYTFSVNISSYIITEHTLGTSAQVGIITAILTLSGVAAGITFSKYVGILKKWLMPFFCLTVAIGFFVTYWVNTSLAGCILGAVLIGVSKVALVPYAINRTASQVPKHMIAITISLLMGCMNLGMLLSTYVVEAVCQALPGGVTVTNKFLASGILAAVAVVTAFLLYTVETKKTTE